MTTVNSHIVRLIAGKYYRLSYGLQGARKKRKTERLLGKNVGVCLKQSNHLNNVRLIIDKTSIKTVSSFERKGTRYIVLSLCLFVARKIQKVARKSQNAKETERDSRKSVFFTKTENNICIRMSLKRNGKRSIKCRAKLRNRVCIMLSRPKVR